MLMFHTCWQSVCSDFHSTCWTHMLLHLFLGQNWCSIAQDDEDRRIFASCLMRTGESQLPLSSILLEPMKCPTSTLPAQGTSDWIRTFRMRSPTSAAKGMDLPSSMSWARPGEVQQSKCDKCPSYLQTIALRDINPDSSSAESALTFRCASPPAQSACINAKPERPPARQIFTVHLCFTKISRFLEQEGAKPFP